MEWSRGIHILITVKVVLSCHSLMGSTKSSSMAKSQSQIRERVSIAQPLLLRLNFPGERFTANHGISLEQGQTQTFLFVVDRSDVTYLAIGASIDHEDGQPQKFKMYLTRKQEGKENEVVHSTLTASDSYTHAVRYSRDIVLKRPALGTYFVVVEAVQSFSEMLITAVMDFPESSK